MSSRFFPYQPFPEPLNPVSDKNRGPFCFEIDGKWVPYLLGAVASLAVDSAWKTDVARCTGEARNVLTAILLAKPCHIDVTQGLEMEDCMSCCIRWSDAGILQVFSCGEWVNVPGPGSMVPIGGGSNPQAAPQPGPGECENFIGKVIFFGRWLLPVSVSSGDQITVTNAFGATTDYIVDYPAWRCGDGTEFIVGGCLTGSEIDNAGDPAPAYHHARLIGTDGTNFYDFGDAANSLAPQITIPPGISDASFSFLINSEGPAGSGDLTFDVRICKNVATPISFTTDLGTPSAGVWAVGQTIGFTSVFQAISPSEDTIWVEFSEEVIIDIVNINAWTIHADDGPVKHVWGYAPHGVSSGALGSYTFFDYPTYTNIPLQTGIHANGVYFRGAPGTFSVSLKLTGTV